MATISYIRRANAPKTGAPYVSDSFFQESAVSPRINGKLRLQENPWTLIRKTMSSPIQGGNAKDLVYYPNPKMGVGGWSSVEGSRAVSSAVNGARAQFRGKLYKGGASLGVTFASYVQSREMIVKRSTQIVEAVDVLRNQVKHDSSLFRKESFAGNYLELVFGWKPLLQDIYASCATVIQDADRLEWVKGRSQQAYTGTYKANSESIDSYGGYVECRISAGVRIKNPNAWLAERAGLLNPAAVAWDLVPWSFVVNIIVNTGQLVNQITDFVGLQFMNESTTYRGLVGGSNFATNGFGLKDPNFAFCRTLYSHQQASRVVGSIPAARLQMRMPNVNWELAAIASSLMVQRIRALDSLFSNSFLERVRRKRRRKNHASSN